MPFRNFRPLIREIKDKHAQENWSKLKIYLDELNASVGNTITQTITNISNGLWKSNTKEVAGSSSGIILDTIPLSSLCAVHYEICISDNLKTKKMRLKLTASKDDNGVNDLVYGKSGTYINVAFTSLVSGSNFELRCDNNEIFAVDIKLTKLE